MWDEDRWSLGYDDAYRVVILQDCRCGALSMVVLILWMIYEMRVVGVEILTLIIIVKNLVPIIVDGSSAIYKYISCAPYF